MFILTFVFYFIQKIAMKAELEGGGGGKTNEDEQEFNANLPIFYGAVLSGKSWFVIFFINIHHLVKEKESSLIVLYKVYSGL